VAQVRWTPQAVDDLEAICLFIARDAPSVAAIFAERAFDVSDRLAHFPESGRIVPEINNPTFREVLLGKYRIIYRIRSGDVQILTVHHGARELPARELESKNNASGTAHHMSPVIRLTLLITLSILIYIPSICVQPVRATPSLQQNEEDLIPLTTEERSLNYHDVIANQPDFVADLTFFRSERFSGGGGAMRVARKSNRYREESQFWIFIGEVGKPAARLFTGDKTYDDLEPVRYERANSSQPFNPATLAQETGTTFEALGTVTIEGHSCIKIKATQKGKPATIYLYAARDLKNLVIVAQFVDPPRRFVQRLSNISLEVPDSLVEIPPDFKPIQHDRWEKVETARVTYKGRQSKDYGVFRAPGGELFIWINDAGYPWHYLVRPDDATVETAFQGLLVTRAGKYVWQTNETVAFSRTYYHDQKPRRYKTIEETHVIVTPNSVEFRSNNYDRDKAMMKVSW
jgi:toxin ParE1/3/4